MITWILHKFLSSQNNKQLRRLNSEVEKINQIEKGFQSLTDQQILKTSQGLQASLAAADESNQAELLRQMRPEAFALAKNAARRLCGKRLQLGGAEMTWNMIPYDVQILGGLAMAEGNIAEMATGEGKTLACTMPAFLYALTGKGVHIATANEYLAQRDAEWMGYLYKMLGLTTSCILNGQESEEKQRLYQCDITYGTASEFGFDFLRDNGMAATPRDYVQRGHAFAIVDEIDSILIDEARTPLIITGAIPQGERNPSFFLEYKPGIEKIVKAQRRICDGWAKDAKGAVDSGNLELAGERLFRIKLSQPRHRVLLKLKEEPQFARLLEKTELKYYSEANRDAFIELKEDLLFWIDERGNDAILSDKGREFLLGANADDLILPDLLTQLFELNQDTMLSESDREQEKRAAEKNHEDLSLRLHHISQLLRAYCNYERDVDYVVQKGEVVIIDPNLNRPMPGRRWSDGLHQAIEAKEGVEIHEETQTFASVTIQNYFRLYQHLCGMTGTAMPQRAEFEIIYNLGVVTIPTHRECQRRDLEDLVFPTRNTKFAAVVQEIARAHQRKQPVLVGTGSVDDSERLSRLLRRKKIPHALLNAKNHEAEAEIIAKAGEPGAVTISTNMAGRGTDIRLGEGVAELGGLYVIGTERHESRRVDRQLRGRCARQGDPGTSRFFVSFEDKLMRHFANAERMIRIIEGQFKAGDPLEHPWLTKSIQQAQCRVEDAHYRGRKNAYDFDCVLNKQRERIYEMRDSLISSDRPSVYCVEQSELEDKKAKLEEIENVLTPLPQPYRDFHEHTAPLAILDRAWRHHLTNMDALKDGIFWRSYGQKDPLVEYKIEGFKMFHEMISEVKTEMVEAIRNVPKIEPITEKPKNSRKRSMRKRRIK